MTDRARENRPEVIPGRLTGYLWGVLAVLSCPQFADSCITVLTGTACRRFLGDYWVRWVSH